MSGRLSDHQAALSNSTSGLVAVPCGDPSTDDGGGLTPQALRNLANLGLTSASIAHDMGNLLQVVASALQLIERRAQSYDVAGVCELCEDARLAMDRIVALRRQILRLTGGRPEAALRIDAVALVAQLRNLIELSLGPDILLEIACSPDAPVVLCDGHELENAILNLVLNARDAMPQGGRLVLSLARDDRAWAHPSVVLSHGKGLVLSVRDTGSGMSAEVLNRVFTPFFTTKPSDRGTGLGLPMVSEFARRTGGRVEIESEPGVGTTVNLRLPAA